MKLGITAYCSLLSLCAYAQNPLVCVVNTGVPPIVRAGGGAELLGHLVMVCFGGTPTAPGVPVPLSDVQVSLNTPVTSRILEPVSNKLEALLLIDDNAANVYQGQLTSANTVLFRDVPLDPPGVNGFRTFLIMNIRADTSFLGSSSSLIPLQIVGATSLAGGNAPPLPEPVQIMAFAAPPLPIQFRDAANVAVVPDTGIVYSACTGNNPGLAVDTASTSYPNGRSFVIRIPESAASNFKRRTVGAWVDADQLPPITPQNIFQPSDPNDVPRMLFFSESGFFEPSFSPVNGLNIAGLADSGTRFYIRADNLPAGAKVYTSIYELGRNAGNSRIRSLVPSAQTGDAGPLALSAPATPLEGGLAPMTPYQGYHLAVYEYRHW